MPYWGGEKARAGAGFFSGLWKAKSDKSRVDKMSDEAIGRTTKMMPKKENTDIVLEYRLYRYFSVVLTIHKCLLHKVQYW